MNKTKFMRINEKRKKAESAFFFLLSVQKKRIFMRAMIIEFKETCPFSAE
jgi:hypothetical protein